jgi:hypothetical protein
MNTKFSSNSIILQYILENVLDPSDVVVEAAPAVVETKTDAPGGSPAPAKAAPTPAASSPTSTEKRVNVEHQVCINQLHPSYNLFIITKWSCIYASDGSMVTNK